MIWAASIADGTLLPFAAKVDWEKIVVPLLFALVWVIGAISQAVAKQQQEAANQRKPIKPPSRPREQASQKELDDFVRGYSQPSAPSPPKRKESRPKPKTPPVVAQKPQSVESRHLHSKLEDRHAAVMQSQLEGRADSTAESAPTVVRPTAKVNPSFAGLLKRGNLGPALILGQILAAPPGMPQRNLSPLDPPLGAR
jgi:hypothetical protein